MCTKFGVDSLSRFPSRARTKDRQTNRQTDATERPTNEGGYTAGVGNNETSAWRLKLVSSKR